ncbi:GGDEF domain-containing protein [Quadrisphaera sp. KR29]|uniref:GGDEF domain-containing protein n=1 Tax=Quadrisphaera sp. KR29 TaxID=3461391 RepID=UPI004043CDBC
MARPRLLRRARAWALALALPVTSFASMSLVGLLCERLGVDVQPLLTGTAGAVLGAVGAPGVRPAVDRAAAGRWGWAVLGLLSLAVAALLAALGLGVVVPAACAAVALHGMLVLQRHRSAAVAGAVLVPSAAALAAQAAGWVDGVVPTLVAATVGTALLAFSVPSMALTAQLLERSRRAADALEAERRAHLAELERAALHDPLTGLLGRRGLEGPLARAARGARPEAPSAVLFVDLDGFKAVNDAHGHAAGDALLVAVAQRLVACLRAGDVVARTGGDEFVVVLRELAGAQEAEELAERVRREARRVVELPGGARAAVTASTGVAVAEQPCEAEQLLLAADAAMYSAKRAARAARRDQPLLPAAGSSPA